MNGWHFFNLKIRVFNIGNTFTILHLTFLCRCHSYLTKKSFSMRHVHVMHKLNKNNIKEYHLILHFRVVENGRFQNSFKQIMMHGVITYTIHFYSLFLVSSRSSMSKLRGTGSGGPLSDFRHSSTWHKNCTPALQGPPSLRTTLLSYM